MAYLVTNPMRRRKNGAINSLVYKHLKLTGNKNSPANKAAISAFKRSPEYKPWSVKHATTAKVMAERKKIKPSDELIAYRKKQYSEAAAKKKSAPAPKAKGKSRKAAAASNPRKRRNGIAVRANGLAVRANGRRMRHNGGLLESIKIVAREDFSLPFIGTALAAGAAHFYVAPFLMDGLAKLSGENAAVRFVQERIPYSSTGLAAGMALATGAHFLAKDKFGQAVRLGGGLFFLGVGLDTINYLTRMREESAEGKSEAPATDKSGAYGGLGALQYGSPYAGIEADYAEAKMADASVCGADFSEEEGQALLDGPEAVVECAGGRAPHAQGYRMADSGPYSRFAGRKMHRWGWLIKCVGFKRAAQIASMPPAKRLKVIDALRKQAMATVDSASKEYGVLYNEGKLIGAYADADAAEYSGVVADYGAVVTVGAAL